MGSIQRSVEVESAVTIHTVVGQVTAEQILSHATAFLAEAPTQLVLWDFSAGSLVEVSGEDLRTLVVKSKPITEVRRGGRTVILCPTDLEFGIARMFQTFAELEVMPFEIVVTRDMADARRQLSRT